MKTPKKAGGAVPPVASVIELLQLIAGPALMAESMPLVRARMKLNPEKLALLLGRLVNPDERIGQGEECTLRGVSANTMKAMKDARLFPRFLNGK